jgi:hypothetical protein
MNFRASARYYYGGLLKWGAGLRMAASDRTQRSISRSTAASTAARQSHHAL